MRKTINISLILLMALAIASCNSHEEPVNKNPSQPVSTGFATMQLQPRRISGDVQLPGVMQPFEYVQLFPKVNGFIKTVYVDRGSVVHQGQVLITLEAPEIEQEVASAKLKYTQAQASYLASKDRFDRLLETSRTPGTVSPYDLEAASAKMKGDSATAQGEYASYQALETMKSYLVVTAPFDGVITERNVHPGALAGPGAQNAKPMLILQQLSRLRLVVDVPEQYTTQINDGDVVKYVANSIPGKTFSGKISRSSGSLNNSFRSETIEVDVDNKDREFKPGMYAEVVIPTSGTANAFVVPKSAVVVTTERKYVVAIEENNVAKWVDVSEGNQGNDSTEIFGNLKTGDVVMVKANYQIKDGKTVY